MSFVRSTPSVPQRNRELHRLERRAATGVGVAMLTVSVPNLVTLPSLVVAAAGILCFGAAVDHVRYLRLHRHLRTDPASQRLLMLRRLAAFGCAAAAVIAATHLS